MLPNLLFQSTKMLHHKNVIQAEQAKSLNIPLVDRDASFLHPTPQWIASTVV